MPIVISLDRMLAERGMTSAELARRMGMSEVNISNIKMGKIKAVRLSTLDKLTDVLECGPEDIVVKVPAEEVWDEAASLQFKD